MADPYGLYDGGGVLSELGAMRGGGGGGGGGGGDGGVGGVGPAPGPTIGYHQQHQSMMSSLMGLTDPQDSMLMGGGGGGMMHSHQSAGYGHLQQQQQQHHQPMQQQHHQQGGAAGQTAAKLQHYQQQQQQYGDYATTAAQQQSRLHHMAGGVVDPALRAQSPMTQQQQQQQSHMGPTMMQSSMMQQASPYNRSPQVNPGMYSMHNSGAAVGGQHAGMLHHQQQQQQHHPAHPQQQQQATHVQQHSHPQQQTPQVHPQQQGQQHPQQQQSQQASMQMMWGGQYSPHPQQTQQHPQQQQQQHTQQHPQQHAQNQSYMQRNQWMESADSIDPLRLGIFADLEQPSRGNVQQQQQHMTQQQLAAAGKIGGAGSSHSGSDNSPNYPAGGAGYHAAPDPATVRRPLQQQQQQQQQHVYSYGDVGAMGQHHHLQPAQPSTGVVKMPAGYGTGYGAGPNGSPHSHQQQQYQMQSQQMQQQHAVMGPSTDAMAVGAARAHYPPAASQQPTVPNGSPQYRSAYPPQVTLSPRRPTPTPPVGSPMPPPSHTPDRHVMPTPAVVPPAVPTAPAGTYRAPSPSLSPSLGQSSLQQLEQMVMPHCSSPLPPHSSPFQSTGVGPPHHPQGAAPGQNMYPSLEQQRQQPAMGHHPATSSATSTASSVASVGPPQQQQSAVAGLTNMVGSPVPASVGSPGNLNVNVNLGSSVGAANSPAGQQSSPLANTRPGVGQQPPLGGVPGHHHPRPTTFEAHQLQQQLHQLYSIPQTMQTRHKIMEVQEQLRIIQGPMLQQHHSTVIPARMQTPPFPSLGPDGLSPMLHAQHQGPLHPGPQHPSLHPGVAGAPVPHHPNQQLPPLHPPPASVPSTVQSGSPQQQQPPGKSLHQVPSQQQLQQQQGQDVDSIARLQSGQIHSPSQMLPGGQQHSPAPPSMPVGQHPGGSMMPQSQAGGPNYHPFHQQQQHSPMPPGGVNQPHHHHLAAATSQGISPLPYPGAIAGAGYHSGMGEGSPSQQGPGGRPDGVMGETSSSSEASLLPLQAPMQQQQHHMHQLPPLMDDGMGMGLLSGEFSHSNSCDALLGNMDSGGSSMMGGGPMGPYPAQVGQMGNCDAAPPSFSPPLHMSDGADGKKKAAKPKRERKPRAPRAPRVRKPTKKELAAAAAKKKRESVEFGGPDLLSAGDMDSSYMLPSLDGDLGLSTLNGEVAPPVMPPPQSPPAPPKPKRKRPSKKKKKDPEPPSEPEVLEAPPPFIMGEVLGGLGGESSSMTAGLESMMPPPLVGDVGFSMPLPIVPTAATATTTTTTIGDLPAPLDGVAMVSDGTTDSATLPVATEIPIVAPPVIMPVLVYEGPLNEGQIGPVPPVEPPKPPRPKRKRPPKKPKEPKDPNDPDKPPPKKSKKKSSKEPKEPRPPKPPKEPKPPRPPRDRTPKAPKDPNAPPAPSKKSKRKPPAPKSPKAVVDGETPAEEGVETAESGVDSASKPASVTGTSPKPSRPSKPKRKPTKLMFNFSKKRKRTGSSEPSDIEGTPPPSPLPEEDGSKRRSARNTKRKKYIDDIDLAISDDDTLPPLDFDKPAPPQPNEAGLIKPVQFFVNPNEEDAMLVERILSMRTITKDPVEEGGEPTEVEEFYVKYKNFSYLHCDWKTQEELEKGDKRVVMKIKRYKQKKQQSSNIFEFLEEDSFNPEYVECDRILDVTESTDPETSKLIKHFLVKWRGLAYDDSTWELEEDVEPENIEQFTRFGDPPIKDQKEKQCKKRPKAADWQKLDDSRTYKHSNKLREYQLEGLNWLTFSWYNGQNCILADEMGLGKTIQSITFLYEMVLYGIRGPFLVIAPLSTITNWQREFESWSDMNVVVYHGSAASRNMIMEYEMFYKDKEGKRVQGMYKFNAMITTFEIIISDCMDLREIPWRCCVIDEAHRLKNKNCKLLEGLRLMNMEHRVLLSGTPLQNNIDELFSLLNFLEPNRFASSDDFLKEFGDLKSESQVQKLQQLLKPMMLRRLKEDVEKSLGPKEETIIEVELTNIQKKYYRAILERNFSFLAKGTAAANIPSLMNTMMELRKCCIHPYLINGAEEQIQVECRTSNIGDTAVGIGEDPYLHALIHSSGKLVLIDKLLPKLRDGGHRVLIFSQMVRCLDILEDYLVHRRYPFERIDGRVRGNMRQAAIDRFSKPDSDRFVFLLCTRAGGLGINLTAADTVIIFDSDWNPQNDLQAQARCHRIGQQKHVKCYRLICRNTYEREMFDKASLKLGLDKAVLQSMNSAGKDGIAPQQLSKKEIEDLLRKGAYGAIMDDDNAADKFCEEDIDQILQRRTQVIQLESGIKGSTFAKASFVASGNRSDIDIDDPEFWQKWAKRADIDMEALEGKNDLIVTQPRRRIQTRRFGNEDQLMELSELESSDDEDGLLQGRRGKKSRTHRKRKKEEKLEEISEERPMASWGRGECFKVEKGLLTFGWGRWMELIGTSKFKMRVENRHLEEISRIILLYCLRFYRGDEKVRTFAWELICPSSPGNVGAGKDGHAMTSDASSPVSRMRKVKKAKKDAAAAAACRSSPTGAVDIYEWARDPRYDPEAWLVDENYKKHLQRHANRILLRVRLLYYLKQDIIGDQAFRISEGHYVGGLNMHPPWPDGETPVSWWDADSDKSLLVGTYKHGYEKYNVMRLDPTLSFLGKCGPPDGAAVLAEINDNYGDDLEDKLPGKLLMDENDDMSPPSSPKPDGDSKRGDDGKPGEERDPSAFPSVSDCNTRLRRLITGYQRNHKKREQRVVQNARKIERQEKFQAAVREREQRKKDLQQRKWSRREEADFYRVVSTFGVEYIAKENRYEWNRFRNLARLEKKYDETVTEYFRAFYAMCKKVCGKTLTDDEDQQTLLVEAITEERARRCLERIDQLSKLREEILPHPKLDERLKLCKPSPDLPEWWVCGKHDRDLLKGAAKHGLGRMDYHLMHDPELSFHDILKNGPPPSKALYDLLQTSPRASPVPADDKTDYEEGEVKPEVSIQIKTDDAESPTRIVSVLVDRKIRIKREPVDPSEVLQKLEEGATVGEESGKVNAEKLEKDEGLETDEEKRLPASPKEVALKENESEVSAPEETSVADAKCETEASRDVNDETCTLKQLKSPSADGERSPSREDRRSPPPPYEVASSPFVDGQKSTKTETRKSPVPEDRLSPSLKEVPSPSLEDRKSPSLEGRRLPTLKDMLEDRKSPSPEERKSPLPDRRKSPTLEKEESTSLEDVKSSPVADSDSASTAEEPEPTKDLIDAKSPDSAFAIKNETPLVLETVDAMAARPCGSETNRSKDETELEPIAIVASSPAERKSPSPMSLNRSSPRPVSPVAEAAGERAETSKHEEPRATSPVAKSDDEAVDFPGDDRAPSDDSDRESLADACKEDGTDLEPLIKSNALEFDQFEKKKDVSGKEGSVTMVDVDKADVCSQVKVSTIVTDDSVDATEEDATSGELTEKVNAAVISEELVKDEKAPDTAVEIEAMESNDAVQENSLKPDGDHESAKNEEKADGSASDAKKETKLLSDFEEKMEEDDVRTVVLAAETKELSALASPASKAADSEKALGSFAEVDEKMETEDAESQVVSASEIVEDKLATEKTSTFPSNSEELKTVKADLDSTEEPAAGDSLSSVIVKDEREASGNRLSKVEKIGDKAAASISSMASTSATLLMRLMTNRHGDAHWSGDGGDNDYYDPRTPASHDQSMLASSSSDLLYQSHRIDLDYGDGFSPYVMNPSRWPKAFYKFQDRILQVRLEAVMHCVEKNEWPIMRVTPPPPVLPQPTPSSGPSQSGTPVSVIDADSTPQVTPDNTPKRETTPWNTPTHPSEKEGSDSNHAPDPAPNVILFPPRRRRRRRRIEIEAERAKLQALLSQNLNLSQTAALKLKFHLPADTTLKSSTPEPQSQPSTSILPTVTIEKKRSSQAPPPAHQHVTTRGGQRGLPILRASSSSSWDFASAAHHKPTILAKKPVPPTQQQPQSLLQQTTSAEESSIPMDLSAPTPIKNIGSMELTERSLTIEGYLASPTLPPPPPLPPTAAPPSASGSAASAPTETEGLVIDLQMRRQEKKLRLEEQLAKIRNQNQKGSDPAPSSSAGKEDSRQKKRRKLDEIVGSLAASAAPVATSLVMSEREKTSTPTPLLKKLSAVAPQSQQQLSHQQQLQQTVQKQLEQEVRNSSLLNLASKRVDIEKWLAGHTPMPNLSGVTTGTATRRSNVSSGLLPSLPPQQAHQQPPPPPAPSPAMEAAEMMEGRRGRRPRVDPNKLSIERLTGNENVSVVNRLTGKKITGSKAPPLKHLAEWLKQNPMFDVDTKWAQLVKAKANLPEEMQKRVNYPTGRRGRRPGTSASSGAGSSHYSQQGRSSAANTNPSIGNPLSPYANLPPGLGALSSLANANLLAGFPGLKLPGMVEPPGRGGAGSSASSQAAAAAAASMFLPFGGLASLGLANPLFANLAGLGFAGYPFTSSSLAGLTQGSDPGKSSGKDAHHHGSGSSSKTTATTTSTSASSFPMLFPPSGLLYNPLGLGNFGMPTSVPSSVYSLAQASLVNGLCTTRAGTFRTNTTPSNTFGGVGNFPGGASGSSAGAGASGSTPNGMMDMGDSDEDSLRSLMGNNYGDDDSSSSDGAQHHKDAGASGKRKDSQSHSRRGGDSEPKMATAGRDLSTSSSRQPRSGRQAGPGRPPAHQASSRSSLPMDLGARVPSTSLAHAMSQLLPQRPPGRPPSSAASLSAGVSTSRGGPRGGPRMERGARAEMSLVERLEAKALETAVARRNEARAQERSRRAERRSTKRGERADDGPGGGEASTSSASRPQRSPIELNFDHFLVKAAEKHREKEKMFEMEQSMKSFQALSREFLKRDLMWQSSLPQSVAHPISGGGKESSSERLRLPSFGREGQSLLLSKEMRAAAAAMALNTESTSGSSRSTRTSGGGGGGGEQHHRHHHHQHHESKEHRSSRTSSSVSAGGSGGASRSNQSSGERIRLLSEKLKEKLQRTEGPEASAVLAEELAVAAASAVSPAATTPEPAPVKASEAVEPVVTPTKVNDDEGGAAASPVPLSPPAKETVEESGAADKEEDEGKADDEPKS